MQAVPSRAGVGRPQLQPNALFPGIAATPHCCEKQTVGGPPLTQFPAPSQWSSRPPQSSAFWHCVVLGEGDIPHWLPMQVATWQTGAVGQSAAVLHRLAATQLVGPKPPLHLPGTPFAWVQPVPSGATVTPQLPMSP
jgi:hypothetical protein